MPKTSSADAITISLQEIAQHLRDPKPAGPLAPVADKHRQALNQLAELFDARNANLQQTLQDAPAPRVATTQPRVTEQAAAESPNEAEVATPSPLSYNKIVRKIRKRKASSKQKPNRPMTPAQKRRRNQQKKAKQNEAALEQVETEFRGAGYRHQCGTRSRSKAKHGPATATGHQANLATAEL